MIMIFGKSNVGSGKFGCAAKPSIPNFLFVITKFAHLQKTWPTNFERSININILKQLRLKLYDFLQDIFGDR